MKTFFVRVTCFYGMFLKFKDMLFKYNTMYGGSYHLHFLSTPAKKYIRYSIENNMEVIKSDVHDIAPEDSCYIA